MAESLQKRIHSLVKLTLNVEPGAWLVWCDPHGDWLPLLQRIAANRSLGGFELMVVDEQCAGDFGSPVTRRALQDRLDAGESFVLYVRTARNRLGWLWSQALLAERIYDSSLRVQLWEWGWRPSSLTQSDEEVAALARTRLQQDPVTWESGGLQPDLERLLDVLAGPSAPAEEDSLLMQITTEAAGLPPIAADDLVGWRIQTLARLLVTQAQQVAPTAIPENHMLLIPAEQRRLALQLLMRWVDSVRLATSLPELVVDADRTAALAGSLAGVDATLGPFVSRTAEYAVFANTCAQLAQVNGTILLEQLAALWPHLERHHTKGFWGYRSAGESWIVPWGELQRLSAAASDLVAATPAPDAWPTSQAAIAWYASGGWRMDRAGEEIMRNLSANEPELVRLVGPLRTAYRARWEETMIRWSSLWSAAGCPIPRDLTTAGAWLKSELETSTRPTAILVLDALRYDLGATMAERVNVAEQVERAQVVAARAPLPSITALGMAHALPMAAANLVAEVVEGKWRVRTIDTPATTAMNLADAEQRRSWWTTNFLGTRCMTLAEVNATTLPRPSADCRRLMIHDATIDRLGHDEELEFQGSGAAVDRYQHLIERLRDQNWLRILVVTDHGYIHWTNAEERSIPKPQPNPAYASRRALAYSADTALAVWGNRPRAMAPGNSFQLLFPDGAANFAAYGRQGYFHGGASLQEWIIPCVVVEWPVQAEPVNVALGSVERILSRRPKLNIEVTAQSLLREESIPRQVQIVVRHAQSRMILFKSAAQTAQPDQPVLELTLELQPGAVAERNTLLRIELRDPNTEDVLDASDAKLLIEISEW